MHGSLLESVGYGRFGLSYPTGAKGRGNSSPGSKRIGRVGERSRVRGVVKIYSAP